MPSCSGKCSKSRICATIKICPTSIARSFCGWSARVQNVSLPEPRAASSGCSTTRATTTPSAGSRCGSPKRTALPARSDTASCARIAGRGSRSEAVAALIDEGFSRARLREIRAYCLPENTSSRAVLRRNGFDDRGTLARGATVQGRPVDVIAHALERERWNARLSENPAATRS